MRQKTIFAASLAIALAALAGGGVIVLFYGFTPPPWLLTCELAVFAGLAMLCGFSAVVPSVLPWLKMRSIRGAILVCLGVGAMYVPPQFIASAVFLALGIKLVWAEACGLADAEREAEAVTGTAIVRHGQTVATEIVRTGSNGTLAAREAHDEDVPAPARLRA